MASFLPPPPESVRSTIPRPRTSDPAVNDLIVLYMNTEQTLKQLYELKTLIENNEEARLLYLFKNRLEFGTAGIRGPMGPGLCQINDLVVIQTAQGLASYVETTYGMNPVPHVIIGFDTRENSYRYVRFIALAFIQKNIPVYMCEHPAPTPMVAFGVRHYQCQMGIVVTASHNPKTDNGLKVYGPNGTQILSPADTDIQQKILQNLNLWPNATKIQLLSEVTPCLPKDWTELYIRIFGELSKKYLAYIGDLVGPRRDTNKNANLAITFTALHGVGHLFMSRALDIAGFEDVFPVENQKSPDPTFSSVQSPNPEEAGVFDMAFETAHRANSSLIIALDPDADRLGVALYPSKRILTGDEIGTLLGWWAWDNHKATRGLARKTARELGFVDSQGSGVAMSVDEDETEPPPVKDSDCYMVSTAVSSKFLKTMAEIEGFHYMDTLTGFKYIGHVAHSLIQNGKSVIFAYEEALGYMVDSTILDKDGISAAIQILQCAAYLKTTFGRTLEQQLDFLYIRYAYHYSINSYFTCKDPKITDEFFHEMCKAPLTFLGGYKCNRVRDLYFMHDTGERDTVPTLPCSKKSYMVTFWIDDDIELTIRTSGTEPKIKYYSEIKARLTGPEDWSEAMETNNFFDELSIQGKRLIENRLRDALRVAFEKLVKPEQFGLVPAPLD